MTSAATAPKRRELIRAIRDIPRFTSVQSGDITAIQEQDQTYFNRPTHGAHGAHGAAGESHIEEARASRSWFSVTQDAAFNRGLVSGTTTGTPWNVEPLSGVRLHAHVGNPPFKARVAGHYYTPETAFWHDISSGSYTAHGVAQAITWVGLSEATTWEGLSDENNPDNFLSQSVQSQVRKAIRAARGEYFESGYTSQFRKTLGRMYRVLGSRIVETVCDELGAPSIGGEIVAQILKFLVDVKDPSSADLRLVSIAQFLRSQSMLIRDAASTALGALEDRRAAAYLREAAARESHSALKHDFLEIAAELEGK